MGALGIIILSNKYFKLKSLDTLLFVTLPPDNPGYTAGSAAPAAVFERLFKNVKNVVS